jgi:hypothetical protein
MVRSTIISWYKNPNQTCQMDVVRMTNNLWHFKNQSNVWADYSAKCYYLPTRTIISGYVKTNQTCHLDGVRSTTVVPSSDTGESSIHTQFQIVHIHSSSQDMYLHLPCWAALCLVLYLILYKKQSFINYFKLSSANCRSILHLVIQYKMYLNQSNDKPATFRG